MPTEKELAVLGQKFLAQKERDAHRAKMAAKAVKLLIASHRDEYERYLGKAPK